MALEPIAVVGAACRFPGGETLSSFWELLSSGGDAVTEIPDARWSKPFYFHPRPGEPGKSYTWAAGVIRDIDAFDAEFFGISPREARQMDPQQRILLETASEALEDAGLPAARLKGSDAGVYVGVSSIDYATLRLGDPASGDQYFMSGTLTSSVANRLSHFLDLHGPSLAVDTACSSSLVALHLACEALAKREMSAAIVGAVNLLLSPYSFIGFSQASMLSPTGRCYAFDARANGYVRAEGAGVVILKRLSDAKADGDPIRALILGTAVNSDGHTIGLSLPSEASQAALISSVYEKTGIGPDRLSFIEAHGTGTPVGDPIELSALGESLAQPRRSPLPVGSVKTNVGHLETASGMAGLLKAILALQHRVLPASLNFETPNPNIPFDALNLDVVTASRPLPEAPAELIAGVNSFGLGGTNAHAILASPPETAKAAPDAAGKPPPLLLSARSSPALAALAGRWSARLAATEPADFLALLRGAARRRDHHRHRLCCRAADPCELSETLAAFAGGREASAATAGLAIPSARTAFVYSGNGAQFAGMAADALELSAAFRAALRKVDAHLGPLIGWSLATRLKSIDPLDLRRTDIAQPLLFGVEVAITEALREAGIEPDLCFGHSVGEIAAAWAAGALPLATACRVVAARSRHQHRSCGAGTMAALAVAPEEARIELDRIGGDIAIAAVNSRTNVTVSGSPAALSRLAEIAQRKGWRYVPLDLDYAFHSPLLDPIRDDLVAELGALDAADCADRFVSTVFGRAVRGSSLTAEYWWQNIRSPVRFADAVAEIAEETRIFVEIGPSPILQTYLRDGLRARGVEGRVLASLSREPAREDPFPEIAARCYAAGSDLSRHPMFDGAAEVENLPRYPWQRARHWHQTTAEGLSLPAPLREDPLLGFRWQADATSWMQSLSLQTAPWLADHRIEGVAVFPAAVFAAIVLAVARDGLAGSDAVALDELEIRQPLVLEADRSRTLRVSRDPDRTVRIESRPRLSDEGWILHAVARLAAAAGAPPPKLALGPVRERLDRAQLYARAKALGLDYGPQFQVVSSVDVLSPDTARATLVCPDDQSGEARLSALLDGGLQAFLALLAEPLADRSETTLLPWRLGGVRLFAPFGRLPSEAELAVRERGTRSACGTITFFDEAEAAVAAISECWFRRLRLSARPTTAEQTFSFAAVARPHSADDALPFVDTRELLAGAVPRVIPPTSDIALLFDGFVAAASHRALSNWSAGGRRFRIADLIESGDVAVEAAPLLAELLGSLSRCGAADEEDGAWAVAETIDLPEAHLIWQSILADGEALTAELALAAAAAESLPEFLRRGSAAAAQMPAPLVEQFLYDAPSGRKVVEALVSAVLALAARWPAGRALRILEIGAGSGILAARVLDALSDWPGTLLYVATDPDRAQAERLASRLRVMAGVTTAAWSPRDGFDPERLGSRFDLVLSAYGFSRGNLDRPDFAALRQALVPGGVLLLAEPQPNTLWNWIFGQQEGWWRESLDPGLAVPASCPIEERCAALLGEGFASPVSAELAESPWPAALLAARRERDEANAPASPAREPSRVLIVAAAAERRAGLLAESLAARGCPAQVLAPPGAGDGAAFCAALEPAAAEIPDIVLLPPRGECGDRRAATEARLVRVIAFARLIASTCERARTWVVTEDAQQTSVQPQRGGAEDAAVWGIGRTLMNEMPQLDCRLVDLSSGLSNEDAAQCLAAELLAPDGEREIVWTQEGRYGLRLRQAKPARLRAGAARLAVKTPGRLDSLFWEPLVPPEPGPGEVAIRVHAADINFRDVMWALDLLPEEALLGGHAGPTLGLACAGVVRQVGSQGVDLAVGDRVVAIAPSALASEVVARADMVAPLPQGLDFAAAATLPVAFFTVIYALDHLARLQPGERILIHGGAGGIGLAAIQFAKHCGAEVIATAGSAAKRAFLRQFGADHVFGSRDLDFVDATRTLTEGKGVDVVLNSLSGEAMEESLGLVRPFGRFVELGKRDFYAGTRIGLKPLRRNLSYFAVDIDALPLARPDLSQMLIRQTMELIEAGTLRPLPYRPFARAEVGDAFRLMQASGHIGKIVILMDERGPAFHSTLPAASEFKLRADRTYLVTGGLSGFGLASAEWLVARGARALALLGRRGLETPGAAEALARLAALGVEARAFACDVADGAALAATLRAIRAEMPPLGGVVHAAMELADALINDVGAAEIARALLPKLSGALHLDCLTRSDPLDFFLLYSSATTVLGAPGQAAYVAANLALEGVARRRRAEGLPALVVAWGPIADRGYLARNEAMRDALARRLSTNPFSAAEALDALPALAASGEPVVAFAFVRWDGVRRALPILESPTFADFAAAKDGGGSLNLRDRLAELTPDACRDTILCVLTEELRRILAASSLELDPLRPVAELGMDSLMAVELRLALEARLGVQLPLFSLSQQTSLATVAERLAQSLLAPSALRRDIREVGYRYESADEDAIRPPPEAMAAPVGQSAAP